MTAVAGGSVAESTRGRADVLLEVTGLKVHFPIRSGVLIDRTVGHVKAVDGVDMSVRRGTTFGLVGESGCGKTTLGRAILRLIDPTDGHVYFDGADVAELQGERLRKARRRMQMVFQDPMSSLNPRQNVESILTEPLRAHGVPGGRVAYAKRVRELLDVVGLPTNAASRYPHEFSGGQRQRIGIARAIALNPDMIIADEPVSALDVSIQAQVLNLLEELQGRLGLTYVVIAHDLAVVRHISDTIGVMYLGGIVERAPADDLYARPLHPYTQALMSAVPIPDPEVEDSRERILLPGDLPSPANPPSGCRFHTRCPYAQPRCVEERPELRVVAAPDGVPEASVMPAVDLRDPDVHVVACHYAEDIRDGRLLMSEIAHDPRAAVLRDADLSADPTSDTDAFRRPADAE